MGMTDVPGSAREPAAVGDDRSLAAIAIAVASGQRAPLTSHTYAGVYRSFLAFVGAGAGPDELNRETVREYRDELTGAGRSPATARVLRDTFCTKLADRGVAINVIRELAGHAEISTTARYIADYEPGAATARGNVLAEPRLDEPINRSRRLPPRHSHDMLNRSHRRAF